MNALLTMVIGVDLGGFSHAVAAIRKQNMAMYRVGVSCEGIVRSDWPDSVADVKQEFESRPGHQVVDCRWEGDVLTLVADSDDDNDGEVLADAFSDTVAAYAPGTPGYRVRIRSVMVMGSC
jgi:hypothetical protein